MSGDEEYIEELESALIDLVDGQTWWEIQCNTGLSDERCREIEIIYNRINYNNKRHQYNNPMERG